MIVVFIPRVSILSQSYRYQKGLLYNAAINIIFDEDIITNIIFNITKLVMSAKTTFESTLLDHHHYHHHHHHHQHQAKAGLWPAWPSRIVGPRYRSRGYLLGCCQHLTLRLQRSAWMKTNLEP